MKKHVFIIGAKSIGQYGGYETFVDKLIENHKFYDDLHYHIFCKKNGEGHMPLSNIDKDDIISDNEFLSNNAHCYMIHVPQIGPAQAIYYDCASLNKAIKIIKNEKIIDPIVYILACRIGPFMKHYTNIIHSLGGKVYINPDGHEWMRSKWGPLTRKYWKKSEELMVRYADLVICDSINIEKYIHDEYDKKCATFSKIPNTTYIAYGIDIKKSEVKDDDIKWTEFLTKYNIKSNEYYMTCGRFVPENNYYTMIKEFMKSSTKKDFILITTLNKKLSNMLESELHYKSDKRIKFVGPVYDSELLKKIRENAFANLHGHSVGGTNPSLLEGLASTKINLLYDCEFNREVAEDGAMYWGLGDGMLLECINKVENMSKTEINRIYRMALRNVKERFNWKLIIKLYGKIY